MQRRTDQFLVSPKHWHQLVKSYQDNGKHQLPLDHRLAGVLKRTLTLPGHLFRAQLAFEIARINNLEHHQCLNTAVAIEYFHTASLLIDDLPCMDNAIMRRGEPCVHRMFGEAATILGALGLVNRAHVLLLNVLSSASQANTIRALSLLNEHLGFDGVLDGQARDLAFGAVDQSPKTVQLVAIKKTAGLFRLALTLPATISNASAKTVSRLDRLGIYWGLAYQLLDDFADCGGSDPDGSSDLVRNRPNLVLAIGYRAADVRLERLLQVGAGVVRHLVGNESKWVFLDKLQKILSSKAKLIRARVNAA